MMGSYICHRNLVFTIALQKLHFIESMTKKCWDILEVISMNGCENACATNVHQLLPGEVAFYHNNFASRSVQVCKHVIFLILYGIVGYVYIDW